jgi:RNA recognition motif-containing protein
MNIYVGNLSHRVTEKDLRGAFEAFGKVDSVKLIKDRDTGEPRGFGFIDMPNQEEAQLAIKNLNGKEFLGRNINVNEARARRGRGGRSHYSGRRRV